MKKFILSGGLALLLTACLGPRDPLPPHEVLKSVRALPTVLNYIPDQGDPREILGFTEYRGDYGEANPLFFYGLDGRMICKGSYNLPTGFIRGKVDLSCFDGQKRAVGDFAISGKNGQREFGTAKLSVDDGRIELVYGLSDEDFAKRRNKL